MIANESSFEGWASGEGRSVCTIFLPISEIASSIGRPLLMEVDHPYVWLANNVIGNFTIVGGVIDGARQVSQVFVDIKCEKRDAFEAVEVDVIQRLPSSVQYSLEDENDLNN